jgi:anionic cell wall polymer biosynthesis LytR-Cps2A-Psr (LCP) family protein
LRIELYGNTGKNNNPRKKANGSGRKSGKRRKRTVLLIASLLAVVLAVWALIHLTVRPPEKRPGSTVASATPTPSGATDTQAEASAPPTPEGGYKDDFYTVLLLGTDEDDYNADVIMVAAFDKKNGKVNVISVPRDTMVTFQVQ